MDLTKKRMKITKNLKYLKNGSIIANRNALRNIVNTYFIIYK